VFVCLRLTHAIPVALAHHARYLFLLFDDGTTLPLDKWVFTTEAHPMPINATHPRVLREPQRSLVAVGAADKHFVPHGVR